MDLVSKEGASISDPDKALQGDAGHVRMMRFETMAEVERNAKRLTAVVRAWSALRDKSLTTCAYCTFALRPCASLISRAWFTVHATRCVTASISVLAEGNPVPLFFRPPNGRWTSAPIVGRFA